MNSKATSTDSGAVEIVSAGILPGRIVPLRHPGRVLAAIVISFMVLALAYSLVTNPKFEWPIVWKYLFAPSILAGLGTTITLTVVSMFGAVILGVILAACRMSENPILRYVSGAYLWFFRGTPLLVQLIFWFNLGALYPRLGIGIPFGGPELWGMPTNEFLTVWLVAIMGLTLHESAYMAEIVRGGLLAVSPHQREAAAALGMDSFLTFRRIVLPQALRVIVPPTGNQFIGMLKYSSLVSVIALAELLYSAQIIYSQTFETIPILIVVSLWYLFCTSVLTVIQGRIERYYGRGTTRDSGNGSTRANNWVTKLRGRANVINTSDDVAQG